MLLMQKCELAVKSGAKIYANIREDSQISDLSLTHRTSEAFSLHLTDKGYKKKPQRG